MYATADEPAQPTQPVAYPYGRLATARCVNDQRGRTPLLTLWTSGMVSALDAREIAQGREIGAAAAYQRAAVDGQLLTFRPDPHDESFVLDGQTRSRWNVFGHAVDGPLAGSALPPLAHDTQFWFAAAAAHPTVMLGMR